LDEFHWAGPVKCDPVKCELASIFHGETYFSRVDSSSTPGNGQKVKKSKSLEVDRAPGAEFNLEFRISDE